MFEYKTVVTDYEGMQDILTTHAGQGWQLKSATPDTWRFLVSNTLGLHMPTTKEEPEHVVTRELSASYYLLIFERENDLHRGRLTESASEDLSYTLPDLYGDTPGK
jgi:hypothetical protein